ncbi:MAG: FAD-dependent oxidoreductase [Burkholderiales bacterium]|nr:FAD-dependent oxidoreductase [Burkholderiales bacterium]
MRPDVPFSTPPRRGLRIGVAGAGLLGRLMAWTLSRQGHQVSVFDPAPQAMPAHDGHGAAGFTAAGMLSPLAELDTAEPEVAHRGWQSIAHWQAIADELGSRCTQRPHFARNGSLLVAHGSDLGAARRVLQRLEASSTAHAQVQLHALSAERLTQLEPALHGSGGPLHAWWLPGEAHIDTVATMQALHDDAEGVRWHWAQPVQDVAPGQLWLGNPGQTQPLSFDLVCDLRGTGARSATPVRGVRGEVVWLHAPGLTLQRPVRLLHPRHRVYIVPRPGERVLIGASELESEDRSPMSLRSAVELMAAAHSILPELAEARILRLDTNLRPALPDHRPEVHTEPGLLRINGLYRHGWLLAPALIDDALQSLQLGRLPT